MVDVTGELAARIFALFQELVEEIPPGTASVESRRGKYYVDSVISLKPCNARAAAFWVHIQDKWPCVDVSFGSGTTVEVSDKSFDTLVALVKQLASAVIAGRCEERFGFLGIRGTIRVDATNVYRATDFFHPRLVPKTIHYEPYFLHPQR